MSKEKGWGKPREYIRIYKMNQEKNVKHETEEVQERQQAEHHEKRALRV